MGGQTEQIFFTEELQMVNKTWKYFQHIELLGKSIPSHPSQSGYHQGNKKHKCW
jgi:hypothetical protein